MTSLQTAFVNVINLSIAASFLMLAVILLRLFLKRVPKWFVCALWALVAVRLAVPFSLESRWSLVPAWQVSASQREGTGADKSDKQSSVPDIEQGKNATKSQAEDNNVGQTTSQGNEAYQIEGNVGQQSSLVDGGENAASERMLSRTLKEVLLTAGSSVWLVGIIVMLAYFVVSFMRLRFKVRTAARLEAGTGVKVWMSDVVNEPFVLGIVRPRIYVPYNLEEEDLRCVLCHEQAHIRRGDYLWKPLGFLILCVYWFHPLCWISYLLFCRDVEMACDEKATKNLSKEERTRYCQTLLNLGRGSKNFLTGTVAFGENGTKLRIKAVLNYKKPSFWVILAGVTACLAVGIFFMTNPTVHPKEADQPVASSVNLGQEGDKQSLIGVSEKEFDEIYRFMQGFMTFPVIWDFDQQNMSGAVDYFTQKWIWTDVTELEYDAEAKAFYANSDDFAKEMGRYFVMSDSALKAIEDRASQGRVKIYAAKYLPWFWGFSFGIDRVEVKEGSYYVHGYNAEVTESRTRNDDILFLGGNTDPFLEFNAVMVRDEGDGGFRLKELDGLENGPGSKVNVSQISDAEKKELLDFAEFFAGRPVLGQYDLNDLTLVFDFSAQKILQTRSEVVQTRADGRCVVPISELMSFMEQHFYLPKGFEKCLPREGEGMDDYPCLGEDGVTFLKKEVAKDSELRADLPVIQNERYYSFGVYNEDAETLRSTLAVLGAVRGEDGKLRLLYYMPYDL